jgi:hypothetical protein
MPSRADGQQSGQHSGFAVDNLELTTLDDGSLFQRDEVVAGVWRNASVPDLPLPLGCGCAHGCQRCGDL